MQIKQFVINQFENILILTRNMKPCIINVRLVENILSVTTTPYLFKNTVNHCY